jgi:hypothetical protein
LTAPPAAARLSRFTAPLAVLAVNVWICWRLFHTEYLDQLPSIEGAFISLARYISHHWPMYDWFPIWMGGYPFPRAYQPLLHYTVAALSSITGTSPALAYHFVTACAYSLGGVAFYFLANALTRSRVAAFCGALLFSTFSPSLLLFPEVRADAAGWRHARRLQAMVVYGEGPNIAGLAFGMLALAMLHRALERRTRGSIILAGLSLALVPATNWPSTMALLMAIAAYLAALHAREFRDRLKPAMLAGLLAAAFVLPLALPSTILSTFRNANMMGDGPTAGAPRWIGFAILVALAAAVRLALARAPFPLRFAALYTVIATGVVAAASYKGVRLLPQAMRFHLALEIAMLLLVTTAGFELCRRWPEAAKVAVALTLLFAGAEAWQYRHYARSIIRPIDMRRTLEYQEARWFDANAHGARVEAPGTVSFWMNVFTDTPQLIGCCEQSSLSREDFIVDYVTAVGYRSDPETADYTLLWMKAFALEAFASGGPASREHYHAFLFPYRFHGRLSVVWQNGDDAIYRIVERTHGLARVVRLRDIVKDPPENGIDVTELRPFVAALDDSSLPVAATVWRDVNDARIRARMSADQVISVAFNYHPGWRAAANGKSVPVRADGLGLIVIEPGCSGDCTINLHWSPGPEPWICIAISVTAMAGALVWWRRGRYSA